MEQATLMFGIGATKAGTSWLYRYLSMHPECRMPAVKELHYFNSDTPEKVDMHALRIEGKAAQLTAAAQDEDAKKQVKMLMSAEEHREAARVLRAPRDGHAAYRELILKSAEDEGAILGGDITPAYALLSEDTLREMSQLAPKTRFIYIMRDPVDRMWSNVRMNAMRRLEEGQSLNEFANLILERLVKSGHHPSLMQRSDYAGTLEKMDRALPAEDCKVVFFERLFQEKTVRSICTFLGIKYQSADFKKKVHAGRATAMRGDLKIAARALLDDQYKAVEARFGELPTRWQRDMAKVSA